MGEKLALFSFILGIPLLIIGILSLFNLLLNSSNLRDIPLILVLFGPQSLTIIIGLLLIIGGYKIYRVKNFKK